MAVSAIYKKHVLVNAKYYSYMLIQPGNFSVQKQPSRSVLKKMCSENMQQIYRRTPMTKYDFNKVASQIY